MYREKIHGTGRRAPKPSRIERETELELHRTQEKTTEYDANTVSHTVDQAPASALNASWRSGNQLVKVTQRL